ncbi:hypothetical protein X975_23974, partial [Stegodyphus mimosarum]
MKVYNKANNCAMMVLTNSMTEDTLQKVMRFESARDIWLELHKVFEDSSDNQLYNICLQFFKFSWSSDDMAAHLSKFKNLWNELNSGLENKEENRLPEMLLICKILDFERFKLPHSITVANGKSLPAIGKVTIKIVTIVNGMNQIKNLENVWYVPEISKNLFSVLASQDINQNSVFESTFKDYYLKIDGEIVLHGTRNAGGGLFKAVMKTLVPETHINVTENNESTLQLYHKRWGHQDKRHVKAIDEKELNIKSDMKLCKACVCGKSHRLKFGTRKEVTKAGELSQQIFADHLINSFENTITLQSSKMPTPNFDTVFS